MLTVACVLRSGGIYTPEWVTRLKAQVAANLPLPHTFVCLSDVDVPSVITLPLCHDWPGWWAKIESLTLPGPVLYLDLDTVIVGDLSDIARVAMNPLVGSFVLLEDFYRPGGFGSGVMAWYGSEPARFYHAFARAPEDWMRRLGARGDQGFIEEQEHGLTRRWQLLVPGQIVSYKADRCEAGPPAGARIVCLHGRPKFGDMPPDSWARRLWEKAA
jgi:hypothetical protein